MAKNIIWLLFFILVIGNVYIFVSGIHLSDDINHFESGINRLQQENSDLEKKVYEAESLQYTASIAAKLDFTKTSKTFILEDAKYALSR